MNSKQNLTNWYLIYSKPQQEIVAEQNLLRQGYQTYLPMVENHRRRNRRLIITNEPMFSRYLFIALNSKTDNWNPIRSTIGVIRIVKFGIEPAKVHEKFIQQLRDNENAVGLQQIHGKEIKVGDTVRIRDGALEGYQGIFLARTSKERATILLNIASKQTKIHLNEVDIEIAG
jgi:transcriptional antiterminator RfaH